MITGRTPPRFVPTLTDVVDLPAQAPQARPPAPAPAAPVVAASAAVAGVWRDASAQPAPAPAPDLEAEIAERVQALLQERLGQALQLALQDVRPLVREAVAQSLLKTREYP